MAAAVQTNDMVQEASTSCVLEKGSLTITASMLSGCSKSVTLPSQSSLADLQRAVVDAFPLGVHPRGVRIIFGESDLLEKANEGKTLEEMGFTDGSRVQIGVSCVTFMELPSRFTVELNAKKRARSSAFISLYNVRADIPANEVSVELWRKSDHDTFTFDTLAGICKGYTQHWMCGNTPFENQLDCNRPLAEILKSQLANAEPVFDKESRFWKSQDELADEDTVGNCDTLHEHKRRMERQERLDKSGDFSGFRPKYDSSVPGWFIAPADCTEVIINADMSFMKLFRVLLDEDGRPIRAAIYISNPNHDEVEEYDVVLKET